MATTATSFDVSLWYKVQNNNTGLDTNSPLTRESSVIQKQSTKVSMSDAKAAILAFVNALPEDVTDIDIDVCPSQTDQLNSALGLQGY